MRVLGSNGVDNVLFVEGPGRAEVHFCGFDDLCFVIKLSSSEAALSSVIIGITHLVDKVIEEKQRGGEIRRKEALDRAFFAERPTSQVEFTSKHKEYNDEAKVLCPRGEKAFERKAAEVFSLGSKTLTESQMSDVNRGPLEKSCNCDLEKDCQYFAPKFFSLGTLTNEENQP